ncbi:MAG: L,D-transpeptidase [Desulfuromonadia bacterium]
MFHPAIRSLLSLLIVGWLVTLGPRSTADPAATPRDPAHEDLTRVDFPSQRTIPWRPHFIMPHETLESLFGPRWPLVARFNRVDRRHAYPGVTIKVPLDLESVAGYTPMPKVYEPARRHEKYILIELGEQWLGAYEYGRLVFSVPAASGKKGTETPVGTFRVDARHRTHTSSLYRIDGKEEQYPMDYAMRFFIGPDNVSYWIHSRDIPGRPASHGCVGLFDEAMQKRVFGIPVDPVLMDSRRLYDWGVGEEVYDGDTGDLEELEDGPFVEIRGSLPTIAPTPLSPPSGGKGA